MALSFFGFIFGWSTIDTYRGYREVTAFIHQHQQLVNDRLADPKVYAFSLSHDTEHAGTLLIQFDVEDEKTYEMLDSDLDAIWKMRFPPKWDTDIRSNEELGNDYGYAAWGISLVREATVRIGIGAFLSLLVFAAIVWIGSQRRSSPRKKSYDDSICN